MAWIIAGRAGRAAGAALVGVLMTGCGAAPVDAQVFVGRVTDQGQDSIGAVSTGADVSFYLCGGPSSFATMTHWMLGSADASGALALTGDGGHVTGNLADGAGHIETAAGAMLSWTARPATGALEGLYQTLDGACRTGAVIADFGDGQGTRLQGTWCDGASHFAQVTPIKNPLTLDGESLQVEVELTPPVPLVLSRLVAPLPAP